MTPAEILERMRGVLDRACSCEFTLNGCEACEALALLDGLEMKYGAVAPMGDPLRERWAFYGDVNPDEAFMHEDERPAVLLTVKEQNDE